MREIISPLSGIRSPFGGRSLTSPLALFAFGEQGVWFDPSDVANLTWRRNLLTWTQEFDNAAWVKGVNGTASAPVVTANATTAPDGTMTADLVQLRLNGATDGSFSWLYQNLVVPFGATRTTSIYVKAAIAGDVGKVVFLTGTVNTSFTLTADWQRVSNSALLVTGTTISFGVRLRGSDVTANSVDLHIWGAQADEGSVATDYQRISDVNTEVIERFPTATLYQDPAGTTPVTTTGQSVGLMLDKSKGLVLGPELWAGQTPFIQDASGSVGAYNISTRTMTNTGSASSGYPRFQFTLGLVVGRTYLVMGTLNGSRSQISQIRLAGSGTANTLSYNSSTGVFTGRVVAAQAYIEFVTDLDGAESLTIDNISVKELPGNHAVQATTANRPNYGIHPVGGRRNLLERTEDFTVSPWAATALGASTRTNTTTPYSFGLGLVTVTSANGGIRQQKTGLISGQPYTLSFYLESATPNINVVFENGAANFGAVHVVSIDPSTGVFSGVSGFTSTTSVVFGTGRIYTIVSAAAGGNLIANIEWRVTAASGSFLIGRPQFELGSTATAYQRVTDQYNVTEAGVSSVSYLFFDGVNDSLATPSINFAAGPTNPTLGPELVTNGTFAVNVSGWTFEATATNTSTAGVLSGTTGPGTNILAHQIVTTVVGKAYTCIIVTGGESTAVYLSPTTPGGLSLGSTGFATNGTRTVTFVATSTTTYLSVMSVGAASNAALDNISVREIDAAYAPDKMTVFAGVRKNTDAFQATVVGSEVTSSGIFELNAPGGGTVTESYSFRSRGTATVFAGTGGTFLAPTTNVLSATGNISGDLATLRVNGTQAAQSTGDQGTGTYGNYPLFVGSRGGAGLFLNGNLYSLIVRGAQSNTGQISSTETWVAGKTGITI